MYLAYGLAFQKKVDSAWVNLLCLFSWFGEWCVVVVYVGVDFFWCVCCEVTEEYMNNGRVANVCRDIHTSAVESGILNELCRMGVLDKEKRGCEKIFTIRDEHA